MSEIKDLPALYKVLCDSVIKQIPLTQEECSSIMLYVLVENKRLLDEQNKHHGHIGFLLKKLADYENKQRL